MLTIPVIETCNYTITGKGIIKMRQSVLRTLAGAVHDSLEWMAFLEGRRSADGLRITVTSLKVPKQYRTMATCNLANPEALPPNIVGVVHSHHGMSAFFSTTDRESLNPRFPVSVVIAQVRDYSTASLDSNLLGFEYQAEGRALLPCKHLGVLQFTIVPEPQPRGWPRARVGYTQPAKVVPCSLMDTKTRGLTTYYKAPCGLGTSRRAMAVFGADGKAFLDEVAKNTCVPPSLPSVRKPSIPVQHACQSSPWDEDDFLRSWSEV